MLKIFINEWSPVKLQQRNINNVLREHHSCDCVIVIIAENCLFGKKLVIMIIYQANE